GDAVRLPGQLGKAVGRDRRGRVRLAQGAGRVGVAVDGGARGVDHAPDGGLAGGDQHVQGVRAGGARGPPAPRLRDARTGLVVNDLDALGRLAHEVQVVQVPEDHLRLVADAGEVRQAAGTEVVKD